MEETREIKILKLASEIYSLKENPGYNEEEWKMLKSWAARLMNNLKPAFQKMKEDFDKMKEKD